MRHSHLGFYVSKVCITHYYTHTTHSLTMAF
jgi:hypothetical protein